MKTRPWLIAVAVLLFSASPGLAETGTLKVRFVYGGDPPKPDKMEPHLDAQFCGKHELVDETLLVNPETKGIKNVVLYVYTGRGGSELPKSDPAPQTLTFTMQDCRFEPHVLIIQAGDTFVVKGADPVGHNANLNFFRNFPLVSPPPGETYAYVLEEAEPAPIPIECNIHPWMRAYIVVLEHPFAAVSDEDGVVEIKGLPAGEELNFRVFHEAGRIDEVTVNGEQRSWERSRFGVEIKPGMNDLGTVVIRAASLKAE